ncbi:gas vesicle protein [Nocardioides sp. JQ2195]|uniref:gas vesicle protein GvpO n=1 Tax=Nocardioides sp. JQ2195 TaxID=2592334 RepID=UPI0019802748|nr:gas vesicle protein [Nocardioides sp. JQ2195]
MPTQKKPSAQKATTARKSPSGSRKSASSGAGTSKKSASSEAGTRRKAAAPSSEAPRRASASRVAELAAQQLLALTGKEPEGVAGLERTDDGWAVMVEVVELRRIPNTTDVLATYEVEVDSGGDLLGYRRVQRYVRGNVGDESR